MVRTSIVTDFTEICSLDFRPDAFKGASQRILGRSEQHLIFDLGVIRRPGWEGKGSAVKVIIAASCGSQAEIYQLKKTILFLLPPSTIKLKS